MTTASPVASGPAEGRSARLDRALADLLTQAPQMHAAAVVSFDGLPMASALPPGMDEDRVAAMSAALLSLGERAAAGLGRGELSQVYVEGDNGTVFLVSADDEAVLVAVAGKGAKVGLMLFEAKQAAESVAAALRADDADEDAHRAAAAQPVNTQPVNTQPVNTQPVNTQPVNPEPAPQPAVEPETWAAPSNESLVTAAADEWATGSTTAVVLPVAVATPVDPYAQSFDPDASIPPAPAAPAQPVTEGFGHDVPAEDSVPDSIESVVAREWASRNHGWL